MKLTSKTEYALLALTYLARTGSTVTPVSIESIATAQAIPAKFLEQIMMTLKRAGIVRSVKGKSGGYLMAKAPEKICLAEVVRLFDGALAPTKSVSENFYAHSPIEREPKLLQTFREIRDLLAVKLEKTKLSQMI